MPHTQSDDGVQSILEYLHVGFALAKFFSQRAQLTFQANVVSVLFSSATSRVRELAVGTGGLDGAALLLMPGKVSFEYVRPATATLLHPILTLMLVLVERFVRNDLHRYVDHYAIPSSCNCTS